MALKLYGTVASDTTQRVQACLYEKEVHFEFITVNTAAGEHKTPRFLARNPFGELPALEDGDVTLFESRAITQYIANKYDGKGTDLIMKDPIKLAIQTVWMDTENQRFDQPFSKLIEAAIEGNEGGNKDVREYQRKLESVLDVYEQRLKESKYLGGDSFTLADLHHLPGMHYLRSTKAKGWFQGRPHVRAWAADILSRPAWVKVAAMSPW
ncbi:putative glutathione transferase [Helianthus annuus]|uniref:glutathione transferase n=1 Tax=Helianthus annuus TaxID=4232 RepID=A0A251V0D0_HELAN|nr:glutathione S-transferase [Helianthus annuus]KAF5811121.1 putative glutathione transferase [Helianthus annuus]KAJ0589901.1 putative glutathione transferase [Helianthus annuus]KAJ0927841.1 putative glutathione transferase [Helianthus annuus]KAJ0932254.1 putative glutathione transferase [Helianthus annuus]